jgi:hypothetical protein
VDVSLSIFALALDNVLTVEGIALVEWFVHSKAVGVDSNSCWRSPSRSRIVDPSADFVG